MQRRLVAQRIRCVKNEWFKKKARQIEQEMEKGMGDRGMWPSLRDIQRGRADSRPAARDEGGDFCKGSDTVLSRCHSHFYSVLNIISSFDDQVIEEVPQRPVRADMMVPPSSEELCRALGKLKGI